MRGRFTHLAFAALVIAAGAACSGASRGEGPRETDTISPPAEPLATTAATQENPYSEPTSAPQDVPAADFTAWRVLSARIYYDDGGGGDLSTVITTTLDIYDDGTWEFGSSSGMWYVESITDDDWQLWGIDPYGPTEKLVLEGWNGDVADGPIEGSGGYIDYMWIVYREGPPAISAPGTVWMKLGVA